MTVQHYCCSELEELKNGIKRIIIDEKGYHSTSEVVERLAKLIGVNADELL